jgi:exodeoxyribonuclease V gamma subunit
VTGFHVYRAARLEALADVLAQRLKAERPLDVFAPWTVAVGSRGMERWLRHEIAARCGISANVDFPFLREALTRVYGADAEADAAWKPDAMTWRVLALLPPLLETAPFAELRGWLGRSGQRAAVDARGVPAELWRLAREVADVIDRVALFRPDWVRAWEAQRPIPSSDGAPPEWQGVLWRALRAAIPAPPITERFAGAPLPGGAIHVFSVSSAPPAWVDALRRAGAVRAVHLYHLTPSDAYWGELKSRRELSRLPIATGERLRSEQSPLLTALGRHARDAAEELLQGDVIDVDVPDGFPHVEPVDLLRTLHADVLAAHSADEIEQLRPSRVLREGDDSVQIHACHGPTRQVEVLRDALLELFDRHPHIEPRDVVVMTPDVATYAPLVRAAFSEGYASRHTDDGWGPVGGPRIPTYIADVGLKELNPLADVLLRVLTLADARITSSGLADLATLDPVRRRFGFDDLALARIRVWLAEAGARLGADAAERALHALPAQHAYTLAFALDRLALGVTLADEGATSFAEVAPYDEVEGHAADVFGPFAELCARLEHWRRLLRAPRPIQEWVELLPKMVDAFAEVSAKAGFLRVELCEGLEALGEEVGAYDAPVAAQLLLPLFEARFERARRGDRLTTGAVTVCALDPMRSVPFRVVCLLGMDDGAFPRATRGRGFDAVAANPRRGDRDPREEDRNLLLEAVLSAREHLLVFYTAHDVGSGKDLAPAVPIGDLLDVLAVSVHAPGASLRALTTRVHAVQPFSPTGFAPAPTWPAAPRARRYDGRMHAAAVSLARARGGGPPFLALDADLAIAAAPQTYDLETLVKWLRRPVRTLVKDRLGLYVDDEAEALLDRESLELGSLEGWSLASTLAEGFERGGTALDAQRARLAARARLAPGAPGRAHIASGWKPVQAAEIALHALGALEARVRHEVRLAVPVQHVRDGLPREVVVTGTAVAHGTTIVAFGHDDPKSARRLLPAWLRLVALRAQGDPVERAVIVGARKGHGKFNPASCTLLAPSDPAEALAALGAWVAIALEAYVRPVRLVEKTSFVFASSLLRVGPDADPADARAAALGKAAETWHGGYRRHAEKDDVGLAYVFGQEPPWGAKPGDAHADFERLALALWTPIVKGMQS